MCAKVLRGEGAAIDTTRPEGRLIFGVFAAFSEFSRIRNTQLRRFTLDRMIAILGKLDEDVEVNVTFTPRPHGARVTPHVR
jgi:hypothetical protein